MTVVLVHIHDDDGQDARLDCALDLTKAFDAHLLCVQTLPYESYIAMDSLGGIYSLQDVRDRLQVDLDREKTRLSAKLEAAQTQYEWRQIQGNPADTLIDQARLADWVILSRRLQSKQTGGENPILIANHVAIHSRAPVIAVGPKASGFQVHDIAAVAWNGSPEAANALKLALPLLSRAQRVHIVEIGRPSEGVSAPEAAAYLLRHGIEAQICRRPVKSGDVALTLCEALDDLGARYVVMGAYGHSRFRETMFGGVTRDMLDCATVPLVMAH